jgi:hypothetical protein
VFRVYFPISYLGVPFDTSAGSRGAGTEGAFQSRELYQLLAADSAPVPKTTVGFSASPKWKAKAKISHALPDTLEGTATRHHPL